jgi:hypothetical protein
MGRGPGDGLAHGPVEAGSAARALLWLLVGLAVLVALIALTAPELVWSDPGTATEVLLFAMLAGVPGLLLVFWLAFKRRGDDAAEPTHHPEGHPDAREEG